MACPTSCNGGNSIVLTINMASSFLKAGIFKCKSFRCRTPLFSEHRSCNIDRILDPNRDFSVIMLENSKYIPARLQLDGSAENLETISKLNFGLVDSEEEIAKEKLPFEL
ncbi:hypothetical protein SDJN02_12304, partial [Cucurbita argyrosperma subsp. argyrosperma]